MKFTELNGDYLKTLTVLYVEDDVDVRDQLAEYLRRRVARLLIASHGAEGLEVYRQEKPDLIVTDILMPVMDGLDMAREIRKIDFGVPIIVTTAFEQSNYLLRSIEVGVDKYVTKPINTELLYENLLKCTERLQTIEQLRLAAKVFENSVEAILITDTTNTLRWVNRAFTETTGYSQEEVIGKNPKILSSGKQDSEFYQQMWNEIRENGSWKGEIWNRRKNGEIYPELLSVSVLRDVRGKITHYVGIFSDISERKASEEKILHLAHHDNLTGLPNRNLLYDRLTLALSGARRNHKKLALLFVDLDNFKAVNDGYGHHVGDELLKEVAQRLSGLFRSSDTVARLGGDEFLILINEVSDEAAAVAAAEKILAAIPSDLEIGGKKMGVTPSIGIAIYPEHGENLETLIQHADDAMYASKNAGRATFAFYKGQ